MNDDEQVLFDQVLDALDLPEPDHAIKQRIMKAVFFLVVAKEIGIFHMSIPWILLADTLYE